MDKKTGKDYAVKVINKTKLTEVRECVESEA